MPGAIELKRFSTSVDGTESFDLIVPQVNIYMHKAIETLIEKFTATSDYEGMKNLKS